MANVVAPEGSVFVCLACGKMSQDKYGFQPISFGYDESCMLNSEMFPKSRLVLSASGERVKEVLDDPQAPQVCPPA